jgi:hypothetical protein
MPSLGRLPTVFLVSALACGARTSLDGRGGSDAGAAFPVGTFTSCAFGTVTTGPFLIPSGIDEGATLTVTRAGETLTATYDGNGRTYAWTFDETTSTSAVLAESAETTPGFGSGICVYGVGVSNEEFFPTELTATSGALTYEAGTMFVSLDGDLASKMDCGDISSPASVWVTCGGGPAPAVGTPQSAASFPVGDYACTSQLGTFTKSGAMTSIVTSGGTGALSLAQAGAHVTATYGGDVQVMTGTLDLTLTTASTGNGGAGQSLTASCGLGPAANDLAVAAASLTALGPTVFLSFTGTMGAGAACPGTEVTGTLVCEP